MQPKDRVKTIHFDDDAHRGIAEGVEIMRKAVGSTYGPGGRNVLIKKRYVHPILTRDGVTVARDIAGHGNRIQDEDANMAAQLVYQASEKTNKTAGDGTTNTVVVLAALYKEGRRRVIAGEDPMIVKRLLERDLRQLVNFVDGKMQKCNDTMLHQVARISSGDDALGDMIAHLISEIGADGAVNINYHNAPTIEVEKVTGYLLDRGTGWLGQEVQLESPVVLVSQKRIASRSDIIPILNLMTQIAQSEGKQFVIVGDVASAALETLIAATQNPKVPIDGVNIPPPTFGQDGHDYFVDIATYTGAKIILEADSFTSITPEHLGTIRAARVNRDKAILFGDNETGKAIVERIGEIQKQAKDSQATPSLIETLKQRSAKLAGKISVIKVGAATENERERQFFQVEDAVEACKSALSSGVVAGGATTLLFASQAEGIEPFVAEALQAPFRLLMANAAEDGGYRLRQVLNGKYGQGFNLRDMSAEPLDLYKAGIVDPTKVITQALTNAFDIAGNLLTVGTTITEVPEHDEKPAA